MARRTMRALTMTGFGGLDRIETAEVPHPGDPGVGEVLVRIRAAALNHIDLFVLKGLPRASYTFPHVLGADGAGVVESVGTGVDRLEPGQHVVLNPGISCGACEVCLAGDQPLCRDYRILGEHLEGTMAEFVRIPAANAVPVSDRMPPTDWAAFPLVTLTAWRMLVHRARLRPGETVLIWGLGGGVAQAALQIAKLSGARVVATSSSAAKREAARRMGADAVLDHTTADVAREVRALTGVGADVVVDTVGAATWTSSLRALRPKGRLVTCGATSGPEVALDLRRLFWFQWSIIGSTMGSHREFAEVVALAERGHLRPVVDSVRSLEQGSEAFQRLHDGEQFGKLVLEVSP